TEVAVAATAQRPAFAVTGEPTPVIGIAVGTLSQAAATTTAKKTGIRPSLRIADDGGEGPGFPHDRPDPKPKPDPRPTDPLPSPPKDSADAAAFRAAAVRHLGL